MLGFPIKTWGVGPRSTIESAKEQSLRSEESGKQSQQGRPGSPGGEGDARPGGRLLFLSPVRFSSL